MARRADRLDEVLARCTEHQPACRRWAYDLSDLDAAERVGLEAWDAFGHLDVVVNNAADPQAQGGHRTSRRPTSSTP